MTEIVNTLLAKNKESKGLQELKETIIKEGKGMEQAEFVEEVTRDASAEGFIFSLDKVQHFLHVELGCKPKTKEEEKKIIEDLIAPYESMHLFIRD